MKKLSILLFLLLVSSTLFYIEFKDITGNIVADDPESGIVTKIIDGDTLVGNGEHVRLLGMDTDERGEPCYKEAKEKLASLVLNKEVILEPDITDKDQYKRLLRYVFVETDSGVIHVNVYLVSEGLAIARFYEDRKYQDEILAAEVYARENKIGCKWTISSD